MLTLTRKVGETIRIGDDIEIVVKEIRKNQVRIGIVAPREVKIYREEVYDNILAERRAASNEDDAPSGGGGGGPSSGPKPARPRTGSAGAATRKGSRGTTKRTGSGGKQTRVVDKGVKP